MAANQASAVGSLRTLVTSEITYSSTYSQGFTTTLGALGPPSSGSASATNADLIDEVLAGGAGSTALSTSKNGYTFVYAPAGTDSGGHVDAFTVTASPTGPGQTGQNYYFTDETGVIRYETGGPAGKESPPIGGY